MSKLKAMQSVYCYIFPEAWDKIREVENSVPRSVYRVTTPAVDVEKALHSLFNPPLVIPATDEGYFNSDEMHVPIIKRIVNKYSQLVPKLGDFEHSYPTPGSSEGIFKLLTKLKVDGTESIYVLNGEYEGYGEYAGPDDLKMKVNHIDPDETDLGTLEPGIWFISNPSARDGNIIPNKFITDLCDAGHEVILDLAYVGATGPHQFDVSHENISAVVMSFSKPYGVFKDRIGGFAFTREPVHSLYGNKWFKSIKANLEALKLAEELGPDEIGTTKLYKKYRPLQLEIVGEINDEFGLGMKPSDSLLLGYLTGEDAEGLDATQLELIENFKRGKGYRFCLTPYFEEKEIGG